MRGVRFPDINVRFSDDPLPTTSQQEKSSILHDKLYEVTNLCIFVYEIYVKFLYIWFVIYIHILFALFLQKNIEVRKEIQNVIDGNCDRLSSKLRDLLSNQGKTQLYFQESVIAMQQAKSDASDIPQELEKVLQTSNSLIFPKSV